MSLSIISTEKKTIEQNIQKEIFASIDQNENIIFSAGAGAGKTYALIESLKYIIKKYEQRLKSHNQKIICITYTNVATEKVKEQLGNSDLVKTSTIHERVWELIKNYQKELVEIHQDKLKGEIELVKADLISKDKFKRYQELSESQKISFSELMISQKELFYKSHDEKAKDFQAIFESHLNDYPNILKNQSHFKSLVNTIYKLTNYLVCLKEIEKNNYTKINYNATYNVDRLHWMRISHDTLLEYGLKIIQKHKLLQQIIIDRYPYFLIDEYQDTSEQVIKIMSLLSKHSLEINHPFFVGYFGDSAQNIYDSGIGKNINKIHVNLKKINKQFNRRSNKEIITLINNIRNDEIKQESIYDDCEGGSVNFYTGCKDETESFLNKYIDEWEISLKNKLHCFVLTNKSVAGYSGFSNIYTFFGNTKKYKIGHKQLTTEVLSEEVSKLGEIPALLIRIIAFRNKLFEDTTAIQEILNKSIYEDMGIKSLRNIINTLKKSNGKTLMEFVNSLKNLYNESSEKKHKLLISNLFDFEGFPSKSLVSHMTESLFPNIKNNAIEQTEKLITDFLSIDLTEFDLWYKYILREVNNKVVYHTYHGTKGLEYDNVIVLMENAFARDKNYFSSYFLELTSSNETSSEFEQKQNLLYVACSRAIKNLRVLYLDDISEFKEGIKKMFLEVENYTE